MASSVISSPSLASKQLKFERAPAPDNISQWAAGVSRTDTASEVEERSSPTERLAVGRNGNVAEVTPQRRLPIMTPSRMPSNDELQASRRAGPSRVAQPQSSQVIAQSTPRRDAQRPAYSAQAIDIDDDMDDEFDMDAMMMIEAAQAEEDQIAADEATARQLQQEWEIQPPPAGSSRPAAISRTMPTARSRSRTPVPAHAEIINIEDEPVTARIQPRPRAPSPRRVVVNHPWTQEVEQKLQSMFKLPAFRHNQREAIDATLAGKDGWSQQPRIFRDEAMC